MIIFFQSDHYGIETQERAKAIQAKRAFNQTTMELKQSPTFKSAPFTTFQSDHYGIETC